jgi:hypothetical protein
MRALSGFTRERNQKKMSWVRSRGRELVNICHLPEMLTKDRKTRSNHMVESRNGNNAKAPPSQYQEKVLPYSLFHFILTTPPPGQLLLTQHADVQTGTQETECLARGHAHGGSGVPTHSCPWTFCDSKMPPSARIIEVT